MATFKVIKAHDGLQVGDIRVLVPGAITDYMIQNGYWELVEDDKPEPKASVQTNTSAKKTKSK